MKPIFLRFLDELEVQYTTQYATSTHDEHPYKHTIYGLSSMLDKYSVSNVALNLNDKEEFLKLQTPFIAQVTEDIVIVKSVQMLSIIIFNKQIYTATRSVQRLSVAV